MVNRIESEGPPTTVSRRFIAGYTLAQIGAFIGFVPLLGVLLPMKAAVVAPLSASLVLSQAAVWGAVAAGASHLLTGLFSDRTRSRMGRRRPWILAGCILTVLSYGGVFLAGTPGELIVAIVLFQVTFNIMFAPLVALFADKVPDNRKGLVSAFSGLAYPTASLFAAVVIAMALSGELVRHLAVAVAVMALVIPFALAGVRETPAAPSARLNLTHALAAFRDRDFRLAFISRLMVQTAISMNALYLLFYLQQETDVVARLPGIRVDAILGLLIAVCTATALTAGFGAGIWSDRVGGRKRFVCFGGLALATGVAILAVAPEWPGPLVGQLVFGVGLGVFTTSDAALIAQVLPARASIGRDLGVMNVAMTTPQIIAPLAGIVLLAGLGWSLTSVFALSAASALGGSLLILRIRKRL
jgi:MFS family permease